MVSGPAIDSDIGAGGGAGRRAQSGTGLNNNNMTNYFVYHQAVQIMMAYNGEISLLVTFIKELLQEALLVKGFYKLAVGQ